MKILTGSFLNVLFGNSINRNLILIAITTLLFAILVGVGGVMVYDQW